MNIKIDENGGLWIDRKGKRKRVTCRPGGMAAPMADVYYGYCSDDCPLFGEPEYAVQNLIGQQEALCGKQMDYIRICNGTTLVGTIIDERRKA